jgi:hypothetical protein
MTVEGLVLKVPRMRVRAKTVPAADGTVDGPGQICSAEDEHAIHAVAHAIHLNE